MRTTRRAICALIHGHVALALLLPSIALAQEPTIERVPPRLLEHIGTEPPAGLEDRDAAVLLELVVAADGSVSDVRVVESAGEGLEAFDPLAVEAARTFRFEPARIDGRQVAARIRYRYVFEGRREEVVEDAPAEDVPVEEDPAAAETEELAGAPASTEEAEPDPEDDALDASAPVFRARATAEGPPRETTRRTLTREVLTRMPGTRGDALRAVELLPGVGRPALASGAFIVRGSAPGDSQVFLDGNPVPLLYHFGGITSFYASQLLDRIDFVPGNFSVRYGRKIGGILEVDPRDPRTDGFHGYLDINAIDASLMIEGPIGEDFAFALAFRRSYVDAILAGVQGALGDDGPAFLTAPVYWDYQAIATWTPTDQDRIRFLLYGSSDEISLLLANPSDTNFQARGNFGLSTQFHRLQVGWRHVEGIFQQDIQVGFGVNLTNLGIGELLRIDGEFWPLNIRSEWRLQLAENVRTIVGLDMQITPLELDFRGPAATQSEGQPPMMGTSSPTDFSSGLTTAYRPAAYAETNVTLLDQLDLSLGVRADWYRDVEALTVDPRLSTRWRISEQVALRAGVGLFSQPPEFQESVEGLGNPELDPMHALHVGLGGDLRFPEYRLSFTLDGFYKHIWDRVVSTPRGEAPFFTNGGLGRIYGMEVGARMDPGGPIPLFGFLSYTLSRSERLDRPGDAWRLFDFDQTHILTLALVWRIGDGWEAGATFRLVSGNPLTPVAGSILDVRNGTYRPIYGAVNSDRNPFFHRLDVRVEKRWDFGDFDLVFFVDVQNVYNATNREGVLYNYDYSQTMDLPGLPILPSLGLRGEL